MSRTTWIAVGLVLGVAAGVGVSLVLRRRAQALDAEERQFLLELAEGNMQEVQLGELARIHAESPAVRSFAERMFQDHSRSLGELRVLTAALGLSLPARTTPEFQAMKDEFARHHGRSFELAYLDGMLAAHPQGVMEARRMARVATHPEIRALAKRVGPMLEEHARLAREAREALRAERAV